MPTISEKLALLKATCIVEEEKTLILNGKMVKVDLTWPSEDEEGPLFSEEGEPTLFCFETHNFCCEGEDLTPEEVLDRLYNRLTQESIRVANWLTILDRLLPTAETE